MRFADSAPGAFVIQPIQPVCCLPCGPGPLPCSLRFSLACALTFRTLYGSWFFPSVVTHRVITTVRCDEPRPCECQKAREDESQPWPAEPSHVQETGRWWPASELPPVPPPPQPSDVVMQSPPGPSSYGRLELWA
jgi:hypothetical protein